VFGASSDLYLRACMAHAFWSYGLLLLLGPLIRGLQLCALGSFCVGAANFLFLVCSACCCWHLFCSVILCTCLLGS